jgi:phosphoribosylglycinamide formyltransferase 1
LQRKKLKPLSIAVFGSGSGTNLLALLRHQKLNMPSHYEVKAIVTDRECYCLQIAKDHQIPSFTHHYHKPDTREQYDRKTCSMLDTLAEQHHFLIDLIVLAGYMRLVSPYFLEHYGYRVINVHPADLQAVNHEGQRKYVGAHAVFDALHAGERQTRSTVIQVDNTVDTGPILGFGPWVEYTEGEPITKEKAAKHQEKQKRESDWPALIQVVEHIARYLHRESPLEMWKRGDPCAELLALSGLQGLQKPSTML